MILVMLLVVRSLFTLILPISQLYLKLIQTDKMITFTHPRKVVHIVAIVLLLLKQLDLVHGDVGTWWEDTTGLTYPWRQRTRLADDWQRIDPQNISSQFDIFLNMRPTDVSFETKMQHRCVTPSCKNVELNVQVRRQSELPFANFTFQMVKQTVFGKVSLTLPPFDCLYQVNESS